MEDKKVKTKKKAGKVDHLADAVPYLTGRPYGTSSGDMPPIVVDAAKGEMSMSCDVNQVDASEQMAIGLMGNEVSVLDFELQMEYRHKCERCDGVGFLPVGFERSNVYAFAKRELEILTADFNPENPPIVMQFVEPILELCDAFGKSGQSGGSAAFVIEIIAGTLKSLMAQKPIAPISGDDNEWIDQTEACNGNITFQNNRLSSVFKHDVGPAYYTDAVVFKDSTGRTFTASSGALLKDGTRIHNRQNITFPFKAKTFYIDVRSRNDNWVVANQVQVDKMWEYYNASESNEEGRQLDWSDSIK